VRRTEVHRADMRKRWIVRLAETERATLSALITVGRAPARRVTHARILLKADEGENGPSWGDAAIVEALEVSRSTVERVRKRYAEEGLEAALTHRPHTTGHPRRLDGRQEAKLIALVCSKPPDGRDGWTLRLLADKMVELEYADTVSYETVRRTLKKTSSSRG
jgi:transposase